MHSQAHQRAWPADIDPRDAAVGGLVALGLEWWNTHDELVREDAQGPDVSGAVVLPPLPYEIEQDT